MHVIHRKYFFKLLMYVYLYILYKYNQKTQISSILNANL